MTTDATFTNLLAGDDPVVVDALQQRLLLANVQAALFGAAAEAPRVGRYRVLERVGQGSGGAVYRGFDPELSRCVAIKVLPVPRPDDATIARLRREAEALARLNHPHVVAIYDVRFEHELGSIVVVMQWIDGSAADAWQSRSAPDVARIVAVYAAAGEGLAAAHRVGLVHRDVKPSNILVSADPHGAHACDRVHVADFGLARPADLAARSPVDAAHGRDAATGIVGTPGYMAPEQHAGGEVGPAADQYGLCATLVDALTGSLVCEHGDLTAVDRALRRRGVGPRVRRALARGLAPDPARRFATMTDLVAALRPPRRSRARAFGVATATLVVAGALAGFVSPASPHADACGEAEALAPADRVDAIRSAFAASGSMHASEAADRVEAALHAYGQRWQSSWAATCDAARDPAEQDRRRRCLQSLRWDVESLALLLAAPDPSLVSRASSAVAGLTAPETCDSPESTGLETWQPDEPAAREELAGLRRRMSQVRAMSLAGAYPDAAAASRALVDDVDEDRFGPFLVLAHLQLGRALVLAGAFDEGRTRLLDTYFAAVASGHEREAALAATDLAFTIGYRLADADEGRAWARHAEAALDRAGLAGEARAMLLNHRGSIEARAGELVSARAYHELCLSLREPRVHEAPIALAHTLNNLGNVHLLMGEPAQAKAYHARALALREEALGPSHPSVATSRNNLGGAQMLADGPAAARATFERALADAERVLGEDHVDLLQALHNLTTVAHEEGRSQDERRYATRALAIASARLPEGHPDLARSREAVALANAVTR